MLLLGLPVSRTVAPKLKYIRPSPSDTLRSSLLLFIKEHREFCSLSMSISTQVPTSANRYEVRNAEGKVNFAATTGDTPYGEDQFDWQSYLRYRPQWSQDIFDELFRYHAAKGTGPFQVACDFGSGIGINVPELLQKFERVHVLEPGKYNRIEGTQLLKQHIGTGRVVWHCETAHSTSMPYIADGTVDLFSAALAAQYFDFPKWLEQAARKLKSGGTLATLQYGGRGFSASIPGLNKALSDFYTAGEQTGSRQDWLQVSLTDSLA